MHLEDNIEEALWAHIDQLVQDGPKPPSAPGSKALYNGHDPEKLGALSNSLFATVFAEGVSRESTSMAMARERLEQMITEQYSTPSPTLRTQAGSRRPPFWPQSRKRWGQIALVVLMLTIVALAISRVVAVLSPGASCPDVPLPAKKITTKDVSAVIGKLKCEIKTPSKSAL